MNVLHLLLKTTRVTLYLNRHIQELLLIDEVDFMLFSSRGSLKAGKREALCCLLLLVACFSTTELKISSYLTAIPFIDARRITALFTLVARRSVTIGAAVKTHNGQVRSQLLAVADAVKKFQDAFYFSYYNLGILNGSQTPKALAKSSYHLTFS
ncbi:hypothetical protein BDQ12DRAFT_666706 [Crucibulum laeve]|uniref:Uncharacterized protein n=1 Tax=Crucibulum laeve TaxID=68775 RepID=A0A5C3M0D7_9AGAR|nr:hypothetical protein BDQ12DRAFT_666706 [Crucibulum laeve]